MRMSAVALDATSSCRKEPQEPSPHTPPTHETQSRPVSPCRRVEFNLAWNARACTERPSSKKELAREIDKRTFSKRGSPFRCLGLPPSASPSSETSHRTVDGRDAGSLLSAFFPPAVCTAECRRLSQFLDDFRGPERPARSRFFWLH